MANLEQTVDARLWRAILRTRMVTVAQAAAYARVAVSTIRGWIKRGLLPSYKVGPRLTRVDLDDVDKLSVRRDKQDETAAHRSVPLHEQYLFDVDIAAQRLKEYGPPWYYATTSDEVVHLTTDVLAERDPAVAVCGRDLSRAMVSFETNLDGKQTTCPICITRPQIMELFLDAALDRQRLSDFG